MSYKQLVILVVVVALAVVLSVFLLKSLSGGKTADQTPAPAPAVSQAEAAPSGCAAKPTEGEGEAVEGEGDLVVAVPVTEAVIRPRDLFIEHPDLTYEIRKAVDQNHRIRIKQVAVALRAGRTTPVDTSNDDITAKFGGLSSVIKGQGNRLKTVEESVVRIEGKVDDLIKSFQPASTPVSVPVPSPSAPLPEPVPPALEPVEPIEEEVVEELTDPTPALNPAAMTDEEIVKAAAADRTIREELIPQLISVAATEQEKQRLREIITKATAAAEAASK